MEHHNSDRVNPLLAGYRAMWRALGISKPSRALRRLLIVSGQAVLIVLALCVVVVLTWPDIPG